MAPKASGVGSSTHTILARFLIRVIEDSTDSLAGWIPVGEGFLFLNFPVVGGSLFWQLESEGTLLLII